MAIQPRITTVRGIVWKDYRKVARLRNGRSLLLPLSACLTEGDTVVRGRNGVHVRCKNGLARLLPSYFEREAIEIGKLKLEFIIKEITEQEEIDAYRSLSRYHYRDQPLFGRTARLIIRSFHPGYPATIGYIELATPFYMSKPRTAILNRPFRDGSVGWTQWDKETARRSINLVVRIARCVVYPEFRGIGLGQLLVKHAREFARVRWQVGGLKPCFIEISADMLKYVPFAEKADMYFIGETEGNLSRVATDLAYLLQNRRRVRKKEIVREEAFGIVDQQVARMNRAVAIMKENDWTLAQFLERLHKVRRVPSLRDLDVLRHVLSLPKPTYLGGLTPQASRYVRDGVRLLQPNNGFHAELPKIAPLSRPIRVKDLSIHHHSRVGRSRNTSAIQHAFGISPDEIRHDVIDNLTFSIEPGQIAMIVGPSGSGKTTLLRFFDSLRWPKSQRVISAPSNYHPAFFRPIRSRRPLIDALGSRNVATALQLMGVVGLSDAFVYLKRFGELSAGQQYRAMLAKMVWSGHNVWIADEFCVNLDPIAANCVAHRLRRLAQELGAVLIVATPQPELTAHSLQPDVVIRLTTAHENEVMSGEQFLARLGSGPSARRAPTLKIDRAAFERLKKKKQCVSVLAPHVPIQLGPLFVRGNGKTVPAIALEARQTRLDDIRNGEISDAGYRSKKQFLRAQKRNGFVGKSNLTFVRLAPIP